MAQPKKEALIIDMGGTVMLPRPRPYDYLKAAKLDKLTGYHRWQALIAALQNGTMVPEMLEGAYEAAERLSQRYALSLFSDAPDEYNRLCMEPLPVWQYFPEELIIPNRVMPHADGKQNPENWKAAAKYLREKGYEAKAAVEDDLGAIFAMHRANMGLMAYHVHDGSGAAQEKTIPFGRGTLTYRAAGSLKDAADDLLK